MTHLLYGNEETVEDWAAIMPMLPSPHVPAGEVWVVSLDGLFAEGSVLGEIIAHGPAWRNEMATKGTKDEVRPTGEEHWAKIDRLEQRLAQATAERNEAIRLLREGIGEIEPPVDEPRTHSWRVRRLLDAVVGD